MLYMIATGVYSDFVAWGLRTGLAPPALEGVAAPTRWVTTGGRIRMLLAATEDVDWNNRAGP